MEVGKRPVKRVEPSIQAGNVRRFAMFDKGVAINKGEAVAANNATEAADSSNLASSPAFTSRGFGSSKKPFLGAASIYRWKVAQGKLLKSADAVIWLEGYSVAEGVEFSAVHSNDSEIWAGGNRGQLVHSIDGGTTWEKVALGDPSAGNVVAILTTVVTFLWTTIAAGRRHRAEHVTTAVNFLQRSERSAVDQQSDAFFGLAAS